MKTYKEPNPEPRLYKFICIWSKLKYILNLSERNYNIQYVLVLMCQTHMMNNYVLLSSCQ